MTEQEYDRTKSIWQQANNRGKAVFVILIGILFSIMVLVFSIPTETKTPTYSPTCITSAQAIVLINNLHNASSTGNEGERALEAIHVFHGKIVVVNNKTHEINISWECLR